MAVAAAMHDVCCWLGCVWDLAIWWNCNKSREIRFSQMWSLLASFAGFSSFWQIIVFWDFCWFINIWWTIGLDWLEKQLQHTCVYTCRQMQVKLNLFNFCVHVITYAQMPRYVCVMHIHGCAGNNDVYHYLMQLQDGLELDASRPVASCRCSWIGGAGFLLTCVCTGAWCGFLLQLG